MPHFTLYPIHLKCGVLLLSPPGLFEGGAHTNSMVVEALPGDTVPKCPVVETDDGNDAKLTAGTSTLP